MSTEQNTATSRRSLEDRLDSYAEAWRPEPGDKLTGELVDVAFVDSEYSDDPYPVLTIRREDGTEAAFHAFRVVARREVKKARPQVGERVGIKYIGEITGKSGQKFHKYRLVVDRTAGAIDYGTPEPDEAEPVDDDVPF